MHPAAGTDRTTAWLATLMLVGLAPCGALADPPVAEGADPTPAVAAGGPVVAAPPQAPAPDGGDAGALEDDAAGADPARDGSGPVPAVGVPIDSWLVLPRVGEYGRLAVARDPIDALLAKGWKPPQAGDKVTAADGQKQAWRRVDAAADQGAPFAPYRGGYAYAALDEPADRVALLVATGHASAWVNGRWLAGDPYGAGPVRLPIELRKGTNHLLFQVAQPVLQASLEDAPDTPTFDPQQATLPDLVVGTPADAWGSVLVTNPTREPLAGCELVTRLGDGAEQATPLDRVESLTCQRSRFRFGRSGEVALGSFPLRVSLRREGTELAACSFEVRVVGPADQQTLTFVSGVDGSVQPYTVVPAARGGDASSKPGVVVALHGRGVGHAEFATHYAAKSWAHILAPSGRGGDAFDWEDWGQRDALEALADFRRRHPVDPRRVYATGHAAGGHGAWRLGVARPDLFAAIAPSAGWLSAWTYGGVAEPADPTPIDRALARAAGSADTLAQLRNLGPVGVYLLHGTDDRLVGVDQSRYARARLAEFHADFAYYERPGAGNWWGPECCDWPPLMQFLQARERPLPGDVPHVEFTTYDPAESRGVYWARVERQERVGEASRVALDRNASLSAFQGTTENVALLSLDPDVTPGRGPVAVRLDDSPPMAIRRPARGQRVWLAREPGAAWRQVRAPREGAQDRRRRGFKALFDRDPLLVYGTRGSREENAWARNKALFDAQFFAFRGGGALEVVADASFDPKAEPDRNVVLYGNAVTNGAWGELLSTSPVQVRPDRVHVEARVESGAGLAVLLVRPRPDSERALVGAIGGTDLVGMRRTDRPRWFIAGVGVPELLVFGAPTPTPSGDDTVGAPTGSAGPDIRAAGFFGPEWEVGDGIAWRDLAL